MSNGRLSKIIPDSQTLEKCQIKLVRGNTTKQIVKCFTAGRSNGRLKQLCRLNRKSGLRDLLTQHKS